MEAELLVTCNPQKLWGGGVRLMRCDPEGALPLIHQNPGTLLSSLSSSQQGCQVCFPYIPMSCLPSLLVASWRLQLISAESILVPP